MMMCIAAVTLSFVVPRASPLLPHARTMGAHCAVTHSKLSTLSDVAESYDALLLDQFGVIHDGSVAYEGAVEAVSALQRAGKKIVIISNSSRRRADTVARLRAMGFGPCDDGPDGPPPISVVTSGDLVWEGLAAASARGSDFADLGIRCFVFGNGADDEEYVRSCGKVVAPIEQADFILARGLFTMLGAGPDMLRKPEAPYSAKAEAGVLARAMARAPGGLPLLVANPDLLRPDGADSPMPGQLAARYVAMGGADVRLVGKPYALVYDACRAELARAGVGADARVAAVGDSLHHDVLGAHRNGVDSVFVAGGVHYKELGVPQAQAVAPDSARLDALLDGFADGHDGLRPTHVLAGFCAEL